MNNETLPRIRDELQRDLLEIFRELLKLPELSADDDFFEKGGDSLLATELVLKLEDFVGQTIPETLLFEASTARALASRLAQAATPMLQTAIRISAALDDETPLLFFHGDWTAGGFYVKHLAQMLAPEVPLVAIAPHGMGDELIPESIQAMAADRLATIKQIQPQGPYRLGGHCVGAMVAYETAQLLLAEGQQVEIVAMIDPLWIVNGAPVEIVRESEATHAESSDSSVEEAHNPPTIPDLTPSPESWQRYGDALAVYSASPLTAPLYIFTSQFDGDPWRRMSPDTELLDSVGGHFCWITTQSPAFAEALKKRLQRGSTVGLTRNGPGR